MREREKSDVGFKKQQKTKPMEQRGCFWRRLLLKEVEQSTGLDSISQQTYFVIMWPLIPTNMLQYIFTQSSKVLENYRSDWEVRVTGSIS